MKRTIACLTAVILIISMAGMVSAAEIVQSEDIVYFEDGSYIITNVIQSAARSSNTINGFTRKTYVDANGNTDWQIVLSGTFTYDGTTATCTGSSIDVTIYDNAYYTVSKSAGKSGASAAGSATIGQRFLGITIAKNTYDLTLTCSKDGVLS